MQESVLPLVLTICGEQEGATGAKLVGDVG